ncbi:MAG: helicase-exonuclease AddAB subunit AddA [Clostridiaceae bacterium]|nr:helicase-exonuclease AddAB subunit AddA [Clostridiaceae bacterium]
MPDTKWTKEQQDAIDSRGGNLLVAAAAGAGKTAVLVERILRMITDADNPIDIDQLLVVTFTNAAATEMKERIGQAISAILERNPNDGNIQRQLILLSKASITTVHSFCLDVIRSNLESIDIDPGFRIADDTESTLMKLEALDELFEQQYEEEQEDFFELLECYGDNRDDQELQNMVLDVYNFIQSSPWPEEWLEENTNKFDIPEGLDFSETVWGKILIDTIRIELEGLKEIMVRALDMLKDASGLEEYRPIFRKDISNFDSILKILDDKGEKLWDRLFDALKSIKFAALPRKIGADADLAKKDVVQKIRNNVKEEIKKICNKFVAANSEDIVNDLKLMQPKIKCLVRLVKEFSKKYEEKKSRKSVVDFNDLEHLCLKILSEKGEDGKLKPSPIALRYRERFAEILVDEYQDSNMVQEIIISMISKTDANNPNVFMVGDVKQSIYRFRQARPELFLEKYNTYLPQKGSLFRKILLFKNFRSRKEVVDAVNFIFKQIMSVTVGELDYDDGEALNPGAVFLQSDMRDKVIGGEVEFHLIETDAAEVPDLEEKEEETGAEEEEILDNIQCEARLVGRRILELMKPDEEGRYFCVFDNDKKEYRKVEFRDIVILLRTSKNWSDVFVNELSQMGIPSFADTGTGFFKTVEVQVMLSLLQIIDNPLQDIPLLAVLRSPIVGFTTDELAELRLVQKKGLLFDALKKLAQSGQGDINKKAIEFLENLQKWRDMSLYMSTDQLIWQLYNDTGYYSMVGAMPAGPQRQANLRILFERARQFEETSYKGLFNFIRFIDKLKSSKGDMGSAKILSENDNVVRIMSIHKSKGLEFPVVILAGCGKQFNFKDMKKSILLHQDLGFGPKVVDHKLRLSWPSAARQAIMQKIKAETLSEEMRILYVALTRAKEKFIITGHVNNLPKEAARWSANASVKEDKFPAYEMLKSRSYLDWIVPALIRHKRCSGLRDNPLFGSEFKGLLIDDPSLWDIRIWSKNAVSNENIAEEHRENDFLKWLDELEKKGEDELSEFAEEISKRLSWDYSFDKVTRVPAKVSVTELKRRFDAEMAEEAGAFIEYQPALIKKPLFLQEKRGLSAAEAGTAMHCIMQHLDYGCEDIEAQVRAMIEKDLITEQQAKSVDMAKIRGFLQSPLGKRMLKAEKIYREVPFNIEIPCHELYKDMEDGMCGEETVLLQGIIDCFFEEADGIVLIDYKSDYMPEGGADRIRERYKIQINYYAMALEKLTGKKVKEKYIYLFDNGEILNM